MRSSPPSPQPPQAPTPPLPPPAPPPPRGEGAERPAARGRIAVLDAQRGVAILFMAIVHAAFFAKVSVMAEYYVDRHTTLWPWPYWAIGVLCNLSAPTFWVLSGASLRLLARRNLRRFGSEWQTARFILVRAAIFIVLDLTLMPVFWRPLKEFQYAYEFELLSGLAASMLVLGLVRFLPGRVLGIVALAWFASYPAVVHALSPDAHATGPFWFKLWFFYDFTRDPTVSFPVLGWLPLMAAGWLLGGQLHHPAAQRPRTWVLVGLALHAVWLTIRLTGGYGGFMTWHRGMPLREFFIMCEGPPGIDYITMNLANGAWCFALLWALRGTLERAPMRWLVTLGRASFFAYVIHLPVYKLLARVGLRLLPHADATRFALTCLAGLAIMVPASRAYRRLKERHPDGVLHYF